MNRPLEAFRALSRGQRALALVAVAGGLSALVLTVVMAGRTQWEVLYHQLDSQDAYDVVQALETQGVEYEVSEGGRILVPADQVARLRMTLAGQRLPSRGGPGYELFDENDLTMTQDAFGVRVERAKMGNLREAIETLSPVRRAFVTVTLPKRSHYATRLREHPSAGISLSLAPGARLSEEQVSAMVHLVTGSIGNGIREEDVRITDDQLHLLWPAGDADGQRGHVAHRRLVEEEEHRLESRAMSLLEETIGPGRASVRITVDLDTTYKETAKETRSPSNKVPIKETVSLHGDGGRDEDSTTENAAGVEHTLHIQDQPRIQRLSVALLLDRSDPEVSDNEAALGELVKVAAGFDIKRGDTFSSGLVDFFEPEVPSPVSPSWMELLSPWFGPAAEALTVAFVLLVVWRLLRSERRRSRAATVPTGVPEVLDFEALGEVDVRTRLDLYVAHRPTEAREELLHWLHEEEAR